jgi:hypothetical protein
MPLASVVVVSVVFSVKPTPLVGLGVVVVAVAGVVDVVGGKLSPGAKPTSYP